MTEIAFAALQNLPMPLIVLSSLKTIVLANEAMGRLLGLRRDSASSQQESVIDVLQGQTLSQIGIDMLQDGVLPISKP
jgi:PAS domain-containing protein